ncbi:MAG: hypothetical protein U0Z53_21770 [Blastocatellia bacterium]
MREIRRITITTTRRLRASVIRAVCPVCACEVTTLSAREAAVALEVDSGQLAGLMAAGRIHAIPLVSGGWRVCLDSLFG